MKKTSIALLLAAVFAITACSPNDATTKTTPTSSEPSSPAASVALTGDVIATVNGKPIPKARERVLMEQVQQANPGMEYSAEQFKDNLVTQEILYQEAIRLGLDKTESYQVQIELISQSFLANKLFEDFTKKNTISDQEITAEYDRMKAQYAQSQEASSKEFLSRHILVKTQEEAQAIIDQLKSGADFSKLAADSSIDPGSAANGGSLGWAPATTFVEEFGKALLGMDKGATSSAPVQTQFGWHIIQVEDVRKAQAQAQEFPDMNDSIKEQLRKQLAETKFMEYQQKLIDQADVQLAK